MSQHAEPRIFVIALHLDDEFVGELEECLFPGAPGTGVASRPAMNGGTGTHWKAIRVEGAATSRSARLAALYRFQNGEALEGVELVDEVKGAVVTDPGAIDWTGFPVIDAFEAVIRDELERMNSLFDDGAPGRLRRPAPQAPRAGGPASVRRRSRAAPN